MGSSHCTGAPLPERGQFTTGKPAARFQRFTFTFLIRVVSVHLGHYDGPTECA